MGYFVITLGQAYGGEAKQMEALQDRTEKGPLLQWQLEKISLDKNWVLNKDKVIGMILFMNNIANKGI